MIFFLYPPGNEHISHPVGQFGNMRKPFPIGGIFFFPGGYLIDDLTSHFTSLRLRIVDNA